MGVLDLLSQVAADAPLLVIAEDGQWLDRPTTEVLAQQLSPPIRGRLLSGAAGNPLALIELPITAARLARLAPGSASAGTTRGACED